MSTSLLPNVPAHLTIRVLHSDDDIVVIEKPCDLRSVPGHANPPPPCSEKAELLPKRTPKSKSSNNSISGRRTAQEAWVKAIQLMGDDDEEIGTMNNKSVAPIIRGDKVVVNNNDNNMEGAAAKELLDNLGTTANPSCVPRKVETFVKYCHRNSKRLLPSFPDLHHDGNKVVVGCDEPPMRKKQKRGKDTIIISSRLRNIAQTSYARIQQKQRPLMNLPKPTEDWESAIGQLRLLGFGDISGGGTPESSGGGANNNGDSALHVVHRLDCQTSGIMVVARNPTTASILCRAWRERESVRKVYLAHVRRWPPYHDQKVGEGNIDIPLAASKTERIKWEVCPMEEGGKECKTYWKVHEDLDESNNGTGEEAGGPQIQTSVAGEKGITLELHPITGRTHQLRLHCAAIGSGIVGDSLYGDSPIEWFGSRNAAISEKQEVGDNSTINTDVSKTLRLHAHRLTLSHPKTGEEVLFESPKPW